MSLFDVFSRAKNAVDTFTTDLEMRSNNIANMAVTGYKKIDMSFQEVFNQVLKEGTAADEIDNMGGTNPTQLGGGIAVSRTRLDFSQGDLSTGGNLDLAITGDGLFIVSPDEGETYYYTRAGEFYIDSNENLVTEAGYQVYGFSRASSTTDTSTLVPISLSGTTYTSSDITWDDNGILRASYDSSTGSYGSELSFQIALTTFNNLEGLEQVSGTAFAETAASGSAATAITPGSSTTVGSVSARMVEESNVFYTGETIEAMESQRVITAMLNVIKMVNDIISSFISKLG